MPPFASLVLAFAGGCAVVATGYWLARTVWGWTAPLSAYLCGGLAFLWGYFAVVWVGGAGLTGVSVPGWAIAVAAVTVAYELYPNGHHVIADD